MAARVPVAIPLLIVLTSVALPAAGAGQVPAVLMRLPRRSRWSRRGPTDASTTS